MNRGKINFVYYLSAHRKNMTIFDTKNNIAHVVCMAFVFLEFKALRKQQLQDALNECSYGCTFMYRYNCGEYQFVYQPR